MTISFRALRPIVIIFASLLILMYCVSMGRAEPKRFVLVDGTVLYGDLISVGRDYWTISSDTLGIVHVEADRIREIDSASGEKSGDKLSPPESYSDTLTGIGEAMKRDPEVMKIVRSLRNDPEFENIMKDQNIMDAVGRGDISSLLTDPQFLKLLDRQEIREIYEKLEKDGLIR